MAIRKDKKSRLKAGRPPTLHRQQTSLSKRTTSSTIRTYHQLSKDLARAEANDQQEEAAGLKQRLADLGGLEFYQSASIQGQANDRGGDSSILLMDWLANMKPTLSNLARRPKLLEVGALSTTNACSRSGLFDIVRIDLHSQAEGIIQQDFMDRPLPVGNIDRFDIISLSLVLNFVPSPLGRGEMLKRTCQFLTKNVAYDPSSQAQHCLPALFLVLPAACIVNSRFMSEDHFTSMMTSLGYALLQRKQTSKLIYYLWMLRDQGVPTMFAKKEINPGRNRNNFSIVLEP